MKKSTATNKLTEKDLRLFALMHSITDSICKEYGEKITTAIVFEQYKEYGQEVSIRFTKTLKGLKKDSMKTLKANNK